MQAEAANLTKMVRGLLQTGHPASEVAILYPGHIYGDAIEETLLRAQVPVQRYGRNSILDRCTPPVIAPNRSTHNWLLHFVQLNYCAFEAFVFKAACKEPARFRAPDAT